MSGPSGLPLGGTCMRRYLLKLFSAVSHRYGESIIQHRMLLVVGVQLVLIVDANLLAFLLRFEGAVPAAYRDLAFQTLPLVLTIYTAGLWGFDLFRGLWRYVGLHDLANILWASIVSTVALYSVTRWVIGWSDYPRSVIILTGFLSAGFLAGIRLAVR